MASDEPEQPVEEKQMFWPNEPTTLDDLHALYALEHKFAGRVAGTTLYVTSAERKDGVETEIAADQTKKLFMASRLVLIAAMCWALGCGFGFHRSKASSVGEVNTVNSQVVILGGRALGGLRGGARRRHHPDGRVPDWTRKELLFETREGCQTEAGWRRLGKLSPFQNHCSPCGYGLTSSLAQSSCVFGTVVSAPSVVAAMTSAGLEDMLTRIGINEDCS